MNKNSIIRIKSVYNFLNSTIDLSYTIKYLYDINIKYVLLCDTNLSCAINFYNICCQNNINGIIGIEVNIIINDDICNCLLVPINDNGYRKLIYTLNVSYITNLKSNLECVFLYLLDLEYSSDILCFASSSISVNNLCLIREVFDNFYVFFNYLSYDLNTILKIKSLGFKLILIHDIFMHHKQDIMKLDIFNAIKHDINISNILLNKQNYSIYNSLDCLKLVFNIYSKYKHYFYNVNNILYNISFNILEFYKKLNLNIYNCDSNDIQEIVNIAYVFLYKYVNENNLDLALYLNRLDYEIKMIKTLNFMKYIYTIYKIIKWCKVHNIMLGPGRGSCAGSLFVFCIGITSIDPVKYELLFERFINPLRVSRPDIDVDICSTARQKLIKHICNNSVDNIVALHISSYSRLKFKSAFRDIMRSITDMNYPLINSICNKFYDVDSCKSYLDFCTEKIDIIIQSINNVDCKIYINKYFSSYIKYMHYDNDIDIIYRIQDIIYLLKNIYETSINVSHCIKSHTVHASGLIVFDYNVIDIIPVYMSKDINDSYVLSSQFEMQYMEQLGYIKIDILGLDNLTIIDNVVSENYLALCKTGYKGFDNDYFLFDIRVYDMLSLGLSKGIFQFEKNHMSKYLKIMSTYNFNDIVLLLSLNRPGPMSYIDQCISVKKRDVNVKYLHSLLEPILRDTYGVIVYQEQIMLISQQVAGYALYEADLLRYIIGKKMKVLMVNERNKFINKCVFNNINIDTANLIFDDIEKFAGYGFNKSHAVCYAKLSMMTAFLKVRLPSQFLTKMLDCHIKYHKKIFEYIREMVCMSCSIFSPPTFSKYSFCTSIVDNVVVLNICIIKNFPNNVRNMLLNVEYSNDNNYILCCILKHDINISSIFSVLKSLNILDNDLILQKNRCTSNMVFNSCFTHGYLEIKMNYQDNVFVNEILEFGFSIFNINIASFYKFFIDDMYIQNIYFITHIVDNMLYVSNLKNNIMSSISAHKCTFNVSDVIYYIFNKDIFNISNNIRVIMNNNNFIVNLYDTHYCLYHMIKKSIILTILYKDFDNIVNIIKSCFIQNTISNITVTCFIQCYDVNISTSIIINNCFGVNVIDFIKYVLRYKYYTV